MKSKFFTLLYLFLLSFTTVFAQYPTHFYSDWTMTFPTDAIIACGNESAIPPPLLKHQIVDNDGDDLWGMEVSEEIFDISGVDGNGACYKIIRTYTFINWDTWNINNTELGIVNRPDDMILSNANRVVLRHKSVDLGINIFGDEDDNDPYNEQINDDDDGALIILEDISSSDGDLFPRSFIENINGDFVTSGYAENYGYFAYRQIIKVADHDAPIVSEMEDLIFCDTIGTCSANIFLAPPVVIECSDHYRVNYTVSNNESGSTLTQGQFAGYAPFENIYINNVPLGNYSVRYIVEDGCGNFSAINYGIEVKDCLAPTTYCINGLSVNLSPNGTVELWASDFDAGSYDDCNEPISLSFSPDLDSTSVLYECQNVGVNIVKLYATDAVGNYTYCSTFVVVQPNTTNECIGGFTPVSGSIYTEQRDALEGVHVLVNNLTGMDTLMTGIDGTFIPLNLYLGYDYTFSPEKNSHHSNGISIYDLVLLRKHILQTTLLNTPYKLIAADVNRDNAVTLSDVIELMKILLGQQSEFSNNTSWRFVATDYLFPNPSNPWFEPFPEVINYNNLSAEEINLEFVGVKIGDLNGSAISNNYTEIDDRNQKDKIYIQTEDLFLQKGQTYQIPFYSKNLVDIAGFQAALQFEPSELELFGINEGAITELQMNFESGKMGNLPFIYISNNDNKETLFHLNVQAKTNAFLSDLIELNKKDGETEAYNEQLESMDIALLFNSASNISEVKLYQNIPNPFVEETSIGFQLEKESDVILTIYNTQQQIVYQNKSHFDAGIHSLPYRNEQLSNGIYYYSIEVNGKRNTKKMVVLKN